MDVSRRIVGQSLRFSERFAALGFMAERLAGCSMMSKATAAPGAATEKVITEAVDGAGAGHDVSQRDGWSREGSRDYINAPHGAATMRADEDVTFGVAGFLISRCVANSKELRAESDFIVASAIARKP
ncbi:hypothetical protein [Bradyrhizobium sp. 5.13L]